MFDNTMWYLQFHFVCDKLCKSSVFLRHSFSSLFSLQFADHIWIICRETLFLHDLSAFSFLLRLDYLGFWKKKDHPHRMIPGCWQKQSTAFSFSDKISMAEKYSKTQKRWLFCLLYWPKWYNIRGFWRIYYGYDKSR